VKSGDDGPSLFLNQVSGQNVGLAILKGSPGLKVGTGKRNAFLAVDKTGPNLWLSDDKGEERFEVTIDSNEPHLSPSDNEGFETTIGTTDLVTPRTGASHKTSAAQTIYRLRGAVADFPNAWLRAKIGLRQFRVRGLKKVRCETLRACLAYNLSQWVRLRWKVRLTELQS